MPRDQVHDLLKTYLEVLCHLSMPHARTTPKAWVTVPGYVQIPCGKFNFRLSSIGQNMKLALLFAKQSSSVTIPSTTIQTSVLQEQEEHVNHFFQDLTSLLSLLRNL